MEYAVTEAVSATLVWFQEVIKFYFPECCAIWLWSTRLTCTKFQQDIFQVDFAWTKFLSPAGATQTIAQMSWNFSIWKTSLSRLAKQLCSGFFTAQEIAYHLFIAYSSRKYSALVVQFQFWLIRVHCLVPLLSELSFHSEYRFHLPLILSQNHKVFPLYHRTSWFAAVSVVYPRLVLLSANGLVGRLCFPDLASPHLASFVGPKQKQPYIYSARSQLFPTEYAWNYCECPSSSALAHLGCV